MFAVYWSGFLDFVVLVFAKSPSLSVKSRALCKQDSGMECGWGFLSAKFLLIHGQLLKKQDRTKWEAETLGGFGVFYVCVLPSAGKGSPSLESWLAKLRSACIPGPSSLSPRAGQRTAKLINCHDALGFLLDNLNSQLELSHRDFPTSCWAQGQLPQTQAALGARIRASSGLIPLDTQCVD